MPLKTEEIQHLREIEEARFEIREELRTARNHKGCWKKNLWGFLNSSLFITVVVGTALTIFIKSYEVRLQKSDREIAVEAERVAKRLELLEQDRYFLVNMFKSIRDATSAPDRGRIALALHSYRDQLSTAYKDDFKSPILLPGLETVIELVRVEEQNREVEAQVRKAAYEAIETEAPPEQLATLIQASLPKEGLTTEQEELRDLAREAHDKGDGITQLDKERITEAVEEIASTTPTGILQRQSATRLIESPDGGRSRLFIHVASNEQERAAKRWSEKLLTLYPEEIAFAEILQYRDLNLAPRDRASEVRIENEIDRPFAGTVVASLKPALDPELTAEPLLIHERFRSESGRQIEVWLNKDAVLSHP